MFKGKIPGTWDYQIDFEEAIKVYKQELENLKEPKTLKDRRLYYAVSAALVMLLNGLRVSEAIAALNQAAVAGKREVYIKVLKKRDKEVYRAVKIPEEIDLKIIRSQINFWNRERRNYIYKLLREHFGVNCHSHRYAFITFLAIKKNISPAIIQKIIKHSSLDLLSRYIEEKEAERTFNELYQELLRGE